MKTTKENNRPSDKKKKEHARSPLVTETNPEGAQYEDKGPNAEPPKGKLVDGDSTRGGADRE
ncbi:hypothetical protein WBG78_17135 [Chryseolinea sp. T2]|uniref:hypothetical protein n=1 Tax=Chryseolinea sp. T2 TaxID=3129255 RepID=UPI003077622C